MTLHIFVCVLTVPLHIFVCVLTVPLPLVFGPSDLPDPESNNCINFRCFLRRESLCLRPQPKYTLSFLTKTSQIRGV
jgi:hypothetical protein